MDKPNKSIDTSSPKSHQKSKYLTKELAVEKSFLDLTGLIRSIQRAEGNPDCFHKAQGYCEHLDCAWRRHCLENPIDSSSEREGRST